MTSELIVPALALVIAALAAALSFLFGLGAAISLLLAILMLIGVIAYKASSETFQLFLMAGTFGFPLIAGSAGLGIFSGLSAKNRKYLLAAFLISPFSYFLWNAHLTATHHKGEESLALAYVQSNEQLIKLVGRPVEVSRASTTSYADSTKGRYDYVM